MTMTEESAQQIVGRRLLNAYQDIRGGSIYLADGSSDGDWPDSCIGASWIEAELNTRPIPELVLNALPANEVCDLAIAPPVYREAFRPRRDFGQPSLLDQPREQTELDLEYPSMRSSMSAARMLVFALAVEFVVCVGVGLYLFATGRY